MAKEDSNYGWIGSKVTAAVANKFRSRSAIKARNNLGVIQIDMDTKKNIFRDPKLEQLDSYYENRQYDDLPAWDQNQNQSGQYIPIRQRKPRIKQAFAKSLAQRLTSKLVGHSVFPKFVIEDSPDDQAFIKSVIKESGLKSAIIEPFRRMLNSGSSFIRFYLAAGTIKMEWFSSKYCYPEFQENGELASLIVKYIYTDKETKDKNGNYMRRWYKLELTTMADILYDNPEYVESEEPVFVEVERADHELGFVQGEWCVIPLNSGENDSPDGFSLCCDLTDFIDELNYSLSQSSQAVSYNQDPQLALSGMDQDEVDNLIRSATKSWNMGRAGKGEFLESNMTGVNTAIELRDKVRLNIQDISRVVLLDPDKIVGSAQSGRAMEILHDPLKDLVDELREPCEKILKNLVLKLSLLILMSSKRGMPVPIDIPAGYMPTSMDVTLKWPPIFQQTLEDLQKKVALASSAKLGGLIAPRTAVKYVAEDFGIEDIEEELKEIDAAAAALAALNPFGGGF